jgi:SAM-dependent methyltransferase
MRIMPRLGGADLSLMDSIVSMLRCPGCGQQQWDLRAEGLDDLARLEGTLCCGNCGQAFAARSGVLDMVPSAVEDRLAVLRRRLERPSLVRWYEERLRHSLTPLASPLRAADRRQWLLRHRPVGEIRRIVDFGCGRGADLEAMRAAVGHEVALGVDLSYPLLAEAARDAREAGATNVAFVKADLDHLPFAPGGFGWASCYGVLHRVREPARALASMAATLDDGGVFVLLTTHRLTEGALAAGQRFVGAVGRVHLFDRRDVESMATAAGLVLDEWEAWGPVALVTAHRAVPDVPTPVTAVDTSGPDVRADGTR